MAKLIVGCGYLGMRVARRWLDAGSTVYAVTRSPARADEFRRLGLLPIIADVTDAAGIPPLPVVETALYAVGFDRTAGHDRRAVYVDGLRNMLAAMHADTGRFIYVSSTSVYAQQDGEVVDESSPCEPTTDGGRACLAAEQTLSAHRLGARATILRFAGLYGPGRLPQRELVTSGQPIPSPGDTFVNLIQIDDAATAVLAAERHAVPPALYVVADGHPVTRRDFYRHLAKLLGVPAPTFADEARAGSRGATNKRLDPSRALRELQIELAYPTYREGLAASVG
ncbi:MAG: SDR family oxidoreductase [Pirellulales bacterium]